MVRLCAGASEEAVMAATEAGRRGAAEIYSATLAMGQRVRGGQLPRGAGAGAGDERLAPFKTQKQKP